MANGSIPTQSTSNPWFGISMALVGVIVGYGVALNTSGGSGGGMAANAPAPTPPAAAPAPAPTAQDLKPVDPKTDHIRGDPKATISIVEYSDFECPFCARVHPTITQVLESNDDVNWVYRHYPLSFHPNAQKAAEASECAAELGGNDAFWQYADMLFEKGSDNTQLVAYAEAIGLDGTAFGDCVDSGKYATKTSTDMTEGGQAGVTGTPGNVIVNNKTSDTRLVSGAQPAANFQAAIDALR